MSIRNSCLALLVVIVVSACNSGGGNDPPPVVTPGPVASIQILPGSLNLRLGDRSGLQAAGRDAAGRTVNGATFVWSVDDSTVATVSGSGQVEAIGLGSTPVRASVNDVEASIRVTVEASDSRSVATVEIDPPMGVVVEGQAIQYSALGSPGNTLSGPELFSLDISDPAAVPLPVFTPARSESDPAASPDGAAIAFVVVSGSDTHIYRANRNGSNPVRLTNGPGLRDQPAWSPDGARIAYRERLTGQGTDIWTMNSLDGTDAVNLTADFGPTSQSNPAWSQVQLGGSYRIAFSHSESGQGHIWTMRADGGDKIRLTSSTTAYDDQPTWSPDGSRIVFQRSSASIFGDLYWVDAIAGGPGAAVMPLIGPLAGPQFAPAWSPDGRLIAFTSQHAGDQYQVFTVWADGTRLAQRTFAGEHADPVWIID